MRVRSQCAGLVIALVAAAPALADEVYLGTSADNTLYEQFPGGSNGAGDHFFSGTSLSFQHFRGLAAFDVAGVVPADSTINRVSLTLHMSRTIAATVDVSLHSVLADWGESSSDAGGEEGGGDVAEPGDATWTHRFWDTDLWATPGGDFGPLPRATTAVGGIGFYTWDSTPELVSDVQDWLDDPETAFGWILIGAEDTVPSAKRFDTRENPVEAYRPLLFVDFTPIPEPAAFTLLALSGMLAMRRRAARK